MTLQAPFPGKQTNLAVQELQGFNVSLLAGASADTKIDLAAIRSNDTIIAALNNNAGTITDVTGTISISDVRASGTLTLSSVVDTKTATVNDVVYTFSDTPTAAHASVGVGVDDDESAANLAAAINAVEGGPGGNNAFFATAAGAVVTITAREEGTGPNSITLAGGDGTVTASGATLENGTLTGGIESTGTTNQVILFWYNHG